MSRDREDDVPLADEAARKVRAIKAILAVSPSDAATLLGIAAVLDADPLPRRPRPQAGEVPVHPSDWE